MEQLLLVAIFLLVGLVNVLVRWLRQRTEASRPDVDAEPVREPIPPWPGELPPAARVVTPQLPIEATLAAARRTRPPASASRRPPRAHGRLGTRADIRRAIVTMTVLGPCRAQERESEGETPASART